MKRGNKSARKNIIPAFGETSSVNEPPERDIGPMTSKNVILRDLNHMSNDCTRSQLSTELSRMRQLENIYSLTGDPTVESTLNDLNEYKGQIREKKKMLDQVITAQAKILLDGKRNGQLALTYGGGGDCFEGLSDQNFDQKLNDMEKRIIEAKKSLDFRGTDSNLQDALHNYHEVFKQSMESIENIAKNRLKTTKTKVGSLRQFIEETEKTVLPENGCDSFVTEAINELKRLNSLGDLAPKGLPFVPSLPYDFEEDLARLSPTCSNDILDDLGIERPLVQIPMTQFLKHVPELKSAKSIMKKIENKEAHGRRKSGLKKEKRVKF